MELIIDHNELDDVLRRCGSTWNAAQAHGLLCSRLALVGADGASRWLNQVLADTDPDNAFRTECATMLEALWATSSRQLSARQSDFVVLLPDDDDPAQLRAAAMGQWCEGFLHGLVSEQHGDGLKVRLASDPLCDIIKDLLQITRATADDDRDDDGSENAFAELVEYLRVATQITYEELADFRGPEENILSNESATLH